MSKDDNVSPRDAIADFYEKHPYPPAPADLDDYRTTWASRDRRRAEHALLFGVTAFREDLDVLVVGCGTSQAVRHAMRWPQGRVVGIDVSESSLRQTNRLVSKYDLTNLETHLLPIERVSELGESFDLIVCTGVLHHLEDPEAGLRELRSVLRPGGAAYIMVYATHGRHGVTMMQDYARMLGVGTSEAEILDLARTLAGVPEDHPIVPVLRSSPDFRHAAALADALLNPRERTYSTGELIDLVKASGLAFGRWYRQAPYLPYCGSPAASPLAERMQGLPARDQYVAMELLRGSMVRHSLVVHRDDDGPPRQQLAPDGDPGEGLVPLRIPGTIVVEERLPVGAAAVLINRSHTYADLLLPVDEIEKRCHAAINGIRTAAECSSVAGLPSAEAMSLFRRLWWYDQVVFESSS